MPFLGKLWHGGSNCHPLDIIFFYTVVYFCGKFDFGRQKLELHLTVLKFAINSRLSWNIEALSVSPCYFAFTRFMY